MDDTRNGFASRCLPLLIANQSGWVLLNRTTFRARWNGGDAPVDVTTEAASGSLGFGDIGVSSHFGHGIITFAIPFVFETQKGYNLLVRGPANAPKDGAAPLEGLVETDWSPATFTMNWKLTRAEHWVEFSEGEPICMIVPMRRGELAEFEPRLSPIEKSPDLHAAHLAWSRSRGEFLRDLKVPNSEAAKREWQRDYFVGRDGTEHQTRLRLRSFVPGSEADRSACNGDT